MRELLLLIKYQFFNVMRAKWLLFYGIFFFFFTNGLLMFGSEPSKTVASLLSIILFIVPLISILYAAIYWYNSESFHSVLLTQPIQRAQVYFSSWISISVGLVGSYLIGTFGALFFHLHFDFATLVVLFYGSLLSFIFVGLGLLISVLVQDRMKGIGLTFLIWLYFAIFHDLIVFAIAWSLKEYPIEVPSLILMLLNPVDLTRVEVLLNLDLSAMMGYTGKILQKVLSGYLGPILTIGALLLWTFLPTLLGIKVFSKRDLK